MNNMFNNFMNFVGGQTGLSTKLAQLNAQCQQQNVTPEACVRNMLNTGQTTQASFNQAVMLADLITGRNKKPY